MPEVVFHIDNLIIRILAHRRVFSGLSYEMGTEGSQSCAFRDSPLTPSLAES